MVDSGNLVNTTRTLKDETHSQRTKMAKVKISSHIVEKDTKEIVMTTEGNMVIMISHMRGVMTVEDSAETKVKGVVEILATGAVKKDNGKKGVETSL